MSNDQIVQAMGLQPLQPQNQVQIDAVRSDDSFEAAKENLENVMDITMMAVSQMATLAQESQDPRSYRVLNELLVTALAAAKSHVEIKQIDTDTKLKENMSKAPQTVNQNLFVGSTAELADMLERVKKKE